MASPPVLVDTGPLVAWFDRGDGAHARCRSFFADTRRPLVTTWPVLTEVCHLVPAHVVIPFMGFVAQGGIAVDRMDAGREGSNTAVTDAATSGRRLSRIRVGRSAAT